MSQDKLSLDPKHTALLVIDMQNDFCHPEGVHARSKEQLAKIGLTPELIGKITPRVAELLAAARRAGLYIVHTQVIRDPEIDGVDRVHCIVPRTFAVYTNTVGEPSIVPGSWGADTIDELKPLSGEYVLAKPSFSAFYMTNLEMKLRRKGITTVIIAGTVLYACVLHTAFDAYSRDFDVIMVEDAVSTWSPELKQPTLRIVDLILGTVRPAQEVIAALEAKQRT